MTPSTWRELRYQQIFVPVRRRHQSQRVENAKAEDLAAGMQRVAERHARKARSPINK